MYLHSESSYHIHLLPASTTINDSHRPTNSTPPHIGMIPCLIKLPLYLYKELSVNAVLKHYTVVAEPVLYHLVVIILIVYEYPSRLVEYASTRVKKGGDVLDIVLCWQCRLATCQACENVFVDL